MLLPVTTKIEDDVLSIGGVSLQYLKSKYKTPLYIVDIATVKKQCSDYLDSFKFKDYESEIIYASKAFCTISMCQLIKREGLSIDVSNGGELYTTIKSGFEPEKIFFHGNNKSKEEISFGLDYNVGVFIADNFKELDMLDKLASDRGKKQKIMLRITPGIKAHTHKYIQTGAIESKFGFGIHNGAALDAIKYAGGLENLELIGLHAHIGSQIFNIEVYDKLIDTLIVLLKEAKDKLNIVLRQINIGGGLGIKYTSKDQPATIGDLAKLVKNALDKYTKAHGIKVEKICLEPGRSIIGNAGVTLYEAGVVKEITGVKNYLAVDGGMSDNIRTVLYQAKYEAFVANKASYIKKVVDGEIQQPQDIKGRKKYNIVGKHCESGDVIIEDSILPPVDSGDLICTASTGAYCYAMSSNYNGQPKSAVVAVEDGKSWIWVQRQSYEDLVAKDNRLYEE